MTTPGYPSANNGATKPDNNLIMAIIVTVLCCLPIGGYAIYLALQSDKAWNAGNVAEAAEYGAKARQFSIYAVIAGVVFGIIYGILNVVVLSNSGV